MTPLLLVAGLALLIAGGELLVRGATGAAELARIPPAVVGLTVVAAGTSMPELVVSLSSAFRGAADLSVGNVVGSNIYNVALILGLSALIRPLQVLGEAVRLQWPILALSSAALFVLARDGQIDRMEGVLFIAAVIATTAWQIRLARHALADEERERLAEAAPPAPPSWMATLGALAVGLGLLMAGGEAFVRSAIELARSAGLSERVIGLTVVSIGTSMPELVTSVVASLRGRADIAVGNVIGSNIFNILFILGLTATVLPLEVDPGILGRDLPVMVGSTLLLLPLLRTGWTVSRMEGAFLLACAVAYTAWLLLG